MNMKLRLILPLLALGCLAVSCDETDYMTYDTSDNGVYFEEDSISYSFGVTTDDVTTVRIPIKVMGQVSGDQSRTIAYTIEGYSVKNADGTDKILAAVDNQHYAVTEEAVVAPDSITGYLSIQLFRNNLEGDHKVGYTRYGVKIHLQSNDNFTPTLAPENQQLVFVFDKAIEIPWKDASGNPIWYESRYGVWHPYKLVKMVEAFHAYKNIAPGTYEEMATLYGANLENIPFGDPAEYRNIFRKYVKLPAYEFFADPANREAILAEYPDFPFDFPNPFPSLD